MGNCCCKKITEFRKQTRVKKVKNKSLTPDEFLEGSDGCYDNGAIPLKAMVFVTPKYVRKFPKFTMPPFFRVSNSNSTEDINQSSSARGIPSIQVTPVSSSATQHSTPQHQQSVSLEHEPISGLVSLEHHPLQTTFFEVDLQSSSETESRQHLLQLEQHRSSSMHSLSETESRQHALDSRNFRKLQTLSRNIEMAKLDGISEIHDGAIVFLPPKYVKNFLESTRPPSFGVQLTNSNSIENFNQIFTNSPEISSDLNQITPVPTSATQYSRSISSENELVTGQDSSESDRRLLEHDPNQTTTEQSSSETEPIHLFLEHDPNQTTTVPTLSETESGQDLFDSTNVRKLQIPSENVETTNLEEIGARIFLTSKCVQNFSESHQLTNLNSTEIFNQTSSNDQNHVTPVSSSTTQNSTIPEHHQTVSIEYPLTTAQNPSESEQPESSTSFNNESSKH